MVIFVIILLFSANCGFDVVMPTLTAQSRMRIFDELQSTVDELPFVVKMHEPDKECSLLPSRLGDIYLPEDEASFFSAHQILELIFHHSEMIDPEPDCIEDCDEVHTEVPDEFMICPEYLLDHFDNGDVFFNDFLPTGILSSKLIDTEELQVFGYEEEHMLGQYKMKVCLKTNNEYYTSVSRVQEYFELGLGRFLDIDTLCDEDMNQAEDISYLIIEQLIGFQPDDNEDQFQEHDVRHPIPPIMIRADGTLNALSPHSNFFGPGVVLGPVYSDHTELNLPVHDIDLIIVDDEGRRALVIFHDGTCLELYFSVNHENCEERMGKTIVKIKSIGRDWESDLHHTDIPLLSIIGRHHNGSVTESSVIVIDGSFVLDLDSYMEDDEEDKVVFNGQRFSFTRTHITTFKPSSTVVSLRRLSDEDHRRTLRYTDSVVSLNIQFSLCITLFVFSSFLCLCLGMGSVLSLCCCWAYQKCYRGTVREFVISLDDKIPNRIEEGIEDVEENFIRTCSSFVNLTWKRIIHFGGRIAAYYIKNTVLLALCLFGIIAIMFDNIMLFSDYDVSKTYLISCLWSLTIIQCFDMIVLMGFDYFLSSIHTIVKFSTNTSNSDDDDVEAQLEPLLLSSEDKEEELKKKKKRKKSLLKKCTSFFCCCFNYDLVFKHVLNVIVFMGVILSVLTTYMMLIELEKYWILNDGTNDYVGISSFVKLLIGVNTLFVMYKLGCEISVSLTKKCLMFSGIQKRCAKRVICCSYRLCCHRRHHRKKNEEENDRIRKKIDDDREILFDDNMMEEEQQQQQHQLEVEEEDESSHYSSTEDDDENSEEEEEVILSQEDRIPFEISL